MLFESYPIQYLDSHSITSKDEIIYELEDIVHKLHKIDIDKINSVKEKDFTDIKFYLTELLYKLCYT